MKGLKARSQVSLVDLMISITILLMILSIGIIFLINKIKSDVDDQEIEDFIVYKNFLKNLEKEEEDIQFINNSLLNITRFHKFGNISSSDIDRFEGFFFDGYTLYYSSDICIFLLNKSNDYVFVNDTAYAFGKVSDKIVYDSAALIPCQDLLDANLGPCHYYEKSDTLIKPVYINGTYNILYIVLCQIV